MELIEYIKKRIIEIENKLSNIIDHDTIMILKQQKTTYQILLELIEYKQKLKK